MEVENLDTTTTGLSVVDSLAMDPRVSASVEAFYAATLQSVRLAKNDARGRHFVAQRDLKAGSEVWSGEPYAAITDAQRSRTHCAHCLQAPTHTLLRCSRCKMLRYCTTECQRNDWAAVHKEECGMIQSVAPHQPTSSMLLMWRVLIRRIKEEREGKGLPNFDLIRYLTTHYESFPDEKKEHFGVMATLIKNSLSAMSSEITPQEIMHLFCLFACNNFTISDGELKPVGLGIYPPAALINHSCDPNCVIIFDGRRCSVRSIRDIAAGEEITFNYVEVGDPTEVRRKELMENFFFHCTCPRCQANLPEVTPIKGAQEQGELQRAAKYEQEGAEAKKAGDLILARKKYKRALKIRRPLLLPHDPAIGFTLNELMNLCISLAPNVGDTAWMEALFYCGASLAAFEKMYPKGWPLVGLQYLIHGKLSFYLKYTQAALESMQRALPILTVTHGPGHPLVHTLHTMLAEATAEWNYEKDQHPQRLRRLQE